MYNKVASMGDSGNVVQMNKNCKLFKAPSPIKLSLHLMEALQVAEVHEAI